MNAAYEAVITLSVQGPEGQAREVDAVVDTGFTGFLTLPPALVAELGLTFETTGHATLADGLLHSEPASLRDYPTQVQDTRSIKNLDATRLQKSLSRIRAESREGCGVSSGHPAATF